MTGAGAGTGRGCVITGSTRGLGRAFAVALAAAGAPVIVNGTDAGRTEAAAAAIRACGGEAIGVPGSVADAGFCESLIERCVAEFGGIGVLVNNAGLTRDRSVLRLSATEFDEVVAVHLRGTWACSAAAARSMRTAGGGAIVNITSGAGLYGTFGQANYAAAKAGIVGLTRVLDLELHRYGIRVNALAPVGRTDMTAVFEAGDVAHELRFPPPESVAPVVVYLAGPSARHVHGQVLSFDGACLSVWTHPAPAASWTRADGWQATSFADVLTAGVLEQTHPDRWGTGVIAK